LPRENRQLSQFIEQNEAVIGCLLMCLILLLDAMAVCPALHELLHKDAAQAGHECAVTIFTHGKADTANVEVPILVMAMVLEATMAIEFSVFSTSVEHLPPGRAPPVFPEVS
jgi:hypothetical protein